MDKKQEIAQLLIDAGVSGFVNDVRQMVEYHKGCNEFKYDCRFYAYKNNLKSECAPEVLRSKIKNHQFSSIKTDDRYIYFIS